MKKNHTIGLIIAGGVAGMFVLSGASAAGPTSEYYVSSSGTLSVLQGANVNREFFPSGSFALAVDSNVRLKGWISTGNDYTLLGSLIGPNAGDGDLNYYDGTSDGTHNFSVNTANNSVYRFNSDWSNPALLFPLGVSTLGITYDTTDNTLWVSQYSFGSLSNDVIEHRTMTGGLISSFHTGVRSLAALALDPADGTLWVNQQFTKTFYQFDKSGNSLGSQTFAAASGSDYLGGEFAVNGTTVPEPTSVGVIVVGLGMLLNRRTSGKRKSRTNDQSVYQTTFCQERK